MAETFDRQAKTDLTLPEEFNKLFKNKKVQKLTSHKHLEHFNLNQVTPESIFELVDDRALGINQILLSRSGKRLPSQILFSRISYLGGYSAALDPRRVRDLYKKGYTIVVRNIDRYSRTVKAFCLELSMHFPSSTVVMANAYLTPPTKSGFGRHEDYHDVVVIQLSGDKFWQIDARRCSTSVLEHEISCRHSQFGQTVLIPTRQGDILYIPYGVSHGAHAERNVSLHLSFGIHHCHWCLIIRRAIQDTLLHVFDTYPTSSNIFLVSETIRILSHRFSSLELRTSPPLFDEIYFNYDKSVSDIYNGRLRLALQVSTVLEAELHVEVPFWRSSVSIDRSGLVGPALIVANFLARNHASLCDNIGRRLCNA